VALGLELAVAASPSAMTGSTLLSVLELGVGIVGALDVGTQEAGEGDGLARSRRTRARGRPSVGGRRRAPSSPRAVASFICEATVRCQISS
jgi:hypothetical protein